MSPSRLKRTPDLIERRVADETFLLPVKGALANTVEMFALSEVGQFIWSLADGSRGVPELIAEVVREFEVTEDQAKVDVGEFVDQLRAYGLVNDVTD
jgi:coenzyme PQQ synthesis protein D (PqqD)